MTPQEHYEHAEAFIETNRNRDPGDPWVALNIAEAQVHATLALAGFTRDAATGADHVHDFNRAMRVVGEGKSGPIYSNHDTTQPGRPA